MAEANAQTMPQQAQGGPPKRRLRNYLLDSKFQLKYTGMVVLVTVIVAGVLGYFAYQYSRGQTEMFTAQQAAMEGVDAEVMTFIRGEAEAEDRKVMFSIIGGIVILALTL